jgi:hypothetical protein
MHSTKNIYLPPIPSSKYYDPGQQLKLLAIYVQNHVRNFSVTHHYSPYGVIAQSSGYGKSKLVYELRHYFPTVYICLRESPTGSPSRSFIADHIETFKNVHDFVALFYGIFKTLANKEVNIGNQVEFGEKLLADQKFAQDFWDRVKFESINCASILAHEIVYIQSSN